MLGNVLPCRKHGKIRRNEQLNCRVCKASFAVLGNALHCRQHGKIRRKEQLTDCRVCKTLENETCHMASRYFLHFNFVLYLEDDP